MRIATIQKIIDIIRKKDSSEKKISDVNNIVVPKEIVGNVQLIINGENNSVIIKNKNITGNIIINIFGNNNTVVLDENVFVSQHLSILIGQDHPNFGAVNDSKFFISKNSSIESLSYVTYNSNTFCDIEENCMLAFGILLYNTDAHPIFKRGTKEIINKVRGIKIGRHSWIGMHATILKNSIIPPNSILGAHTVFSGATENNQSYCVFAGNPAKIVKENVDWDSNGRIHGYINNN